MKLNLARIIGVAVAAVTITSSSAYAATSPTICKDKTTSASSGRGACSGHGGVDAKATAAAKKAEKDAAKAAKKAEKADAKAAKKVEKQAKKEAPESRPAEKSAKATRSTPRASARASDRANSGSAVVAGNGSAEDNNPSGAIAKCKDGLYSHARSRRGACGHHGGVASWM